MNGSLFDEVGPGFDGSVMRPYSRRLPGTEDVDFVQLSGAEASKPVYRHNVRVQLFDLTDASPESDTGSAALQQVLQRCADQLARPIDYQSYIDENKKPMALVVWDEPSLEKH